MGIGYGFGIGFGFGLLSGLGLSARVRARVLVRVARGMPGLAAGVAYALGARVGAVLLRVRVRVMVRLTPHSYAYPDPCPSPSTHPLRLTLTHHLAQVPDAPTAEAACGGRAGRLRCLVRVRVRVGARLGWLG